MYEFIYYDGVISNLELAFSIDYSVSKFFDQFSIPHSFNYWKHCSNIGT